MDQTSPIQLPSFKPPSAVGVAIKEVFTELLLAPLWWYSGGLLKIGKWWWQEIRTGAKRLSLRILISHWFKPMYGQYDTAGRIISFFFRTLMVVWNMLMMIIWLIGVTVAVVIYLCLPVVAVWQLLVNLRWHL